MSMHRGPSCKGIPIHDAPANKIRTTAHFIYFRFDVLFYNIDILIIKWNTYLVVAILRTLNLPYLQVINQTILSQIC